MGNASSMLTQYDIEEVQEHCSYLFSQQEIVSLYERFCQLDRSAKGFVSEDEFLSIPEFSTNPLSQSRSRCERFCHLDRSTKGLISEDEFLYIPEFSTNVLSQRLLPMVDGLNFKDFVSVLSTFSARASLQQKIESSTNKGVGRSRVHTGFHVIIRRFCDDHRPPWPQDGGGSAHRLSERRMQISADEDARSSLCLLETSVHSQYTV